jgi:hypothetical protein
VNHFTNCPRGEFGFGSELFAPPHDGFRVIRSAEHAGPERAIRLEQAGTLHPQPLGAPAHVSDLRHAVGPTLARTNVGDFRAPAAKDERES